MKRKILALTLAFLMFFSTNISMIKAEENDDLSKYSYTVSDDPNFVDGTMSNPDGYEGPGVEIDGDNVDTIYQSKTRGSGYDLTWTTNESGKKVMLDGDGKAFGYGECKKVIDVSSYNGPIDWQAVKNSGVDGAILRITSFSGGSMHEDDMFATNLAGCRSVNMPFGVYMYSYADCVEDAANEANYVVGLLKKYNIQPSEMGYSVYYDLEENNSTKNLTVDQNANNVEKFVNIIQASGYPVNVYSYTSYLNEKLNSSRIHKYASWIAQYGMRLTFVNNYYTGNYGWQYRSNGSVNGINGDVDVSCFSNFYGYDTENHVNEELGRDTTTPYLEYRANCKNVGWLPYFVEPNTAGTTGRSFPLYQLQVKINNAPNSTHLSGTVKTSKSTLEYENIESDTVLGNAGVAMQQVKFDLDNIPGYHLEYRVHSADIGWQDWVEEGNYAGKETKDIQAIDFRLVADEAESVKSPQIYYRGHIADTGWLEYVPESQIAGQPGSGIFLQALNIGFDNVDEEYTLNGSVYIEGTGWKDISLKDESVVFGTTGQAKAIKGIKLDLQGLSGYSIEYSVYENGKWQDWVGNNEPAGNGDNNIEGVKLRLKYDNTEIEKIELNKSSLTMAKDSQETLIATIRPEDTVMDKTITWKSSDPSIVSVDENGKITANKVGSATITATTVNGLYVTCQVNVEIPISKITLNKDKVTLEKNETIELKATVSPDDATIDKTIKWSSEDEKVAKVDQNGKVTAVDAGTTNIVATTSNGMKAKCSITVTSKITSVSLNKTTAVIDQNGTITLTATINPANTTDSKDISWSSSDPKVAKVEDGKVTGIAEGTATITATTVNGLKDSCKVTVTRQEPNLRYRSHVQDYGWLDWIYNGKTSGTTGENKQMEAIKIELNSGSYKGSIEYSSHVQDYGWMSWIGNGKESGTTGKNKQMEAIKIRLTGDIAKEYNIYYRVHVEEMGWLDWASNGEAAGSTGYSYQIEAIEIKLVEKGETAPGTTTKPFEQRHYIKYAAHVADYGWLAEVYEGNISGTVGKAKQMEAITIALNNPPYDGNIQYRAHVQDEGWQNWRVNGTSAGTSGEARRLEAIEIKLTGEMANKYDVYYRVHCQDYGWLGWAKSGASAGSEGMSKRLEAIEIVFVEKGGKAPGSTSNAFYKK
ncbi:MAG: Ig-like domain-containing protein [Thomasclavelia sp.]